MKRRRQGTELGVVMDSIVSCLCVNSNIQTWAAGITAVATVACACIALFTAIKANAIAKQSSNVTYATLTCGILNTEKLEHITKDIQEIHDFTKNDWDDASACRLDLSNDIECRELTIRSALEEMELLCHLIQERNILPCLTTNIKAKLKLFLSSKRVLQVVKAYSSDLKELLKVYESATNDSEKGKKMSKA